MLTYSYFTRRNYLKALLVLLLGLTLNIANANTGDWALVERFKNQLNSAKSGKISAMYGVAKLYERGRGVNTNVVQAAAWYQKAADAGYITATARLGIMYFEGRGVKQNYAKSLVLLRKAVKGNVASAQHQLANMYELGTGVPQNLKLAIHWYKQSEKNGYYLSKNKLSRLQALMASKSSGTIKRPQKTKAASVPAKAPSALMTRLIRGQWFKRKKPVGYLPSNITNCVDTNSKTLKCISTSQERSTGSEIITYNTESVIRIKSSSSFNISYGNNVLEVAMLTVEDGDGNLIEQSPSRIKKGRQGRDKKLSCTLKNSNLISCVKGNSTFELISR
ncbi:MAG: tetratricopeptide repeat protein [Woeseiaceae bacterium]